MLKDKKRRASPARLFLFVGIFLKRDSDRRDTVAIEKKHLSILHAKDISRTGLYKWKMPQDTAAVIHGVPRYEIACVTGCDERQDEL